MQQFFIKNLFSSLLLIACMLGFTNTAHAEESLNKIVAVVNTDVITQTQLDEQLRYLKALYTASNKPMPAAAVMRKQVLDQLIDNQIQLIAAKEHGIKVEDKQLDAVIANIAKENHLTVAQMKMAIQQQGMNFERYRTQIKEQFTISQLLQQTIRPSISVSDEEAATYRTQHKNVAKLKDDKVKAIIFQEKFKVALKKWLDELRTQAYIKIIS